MVICRKTFDAEERNMIEDNFQWRRKKMYVKQISKVKIDSTFLVWTERVEIEKGLLLILLRKVRVEGVYLEGTTWPKKFFGEAN